MHHYTTSHASREERRYSGTQKKDSKCQNPNQNAFKHLITWNLFFGGGGKAMLIEKKKTEKTLFHHSRIYFLRKS